MQMPTSTSGSHPHGLQTSGNPVGTLVQRPVREVSLSAHHCYSIRGLVTPAPRKAGAHTGLAGAADAVSFHVTNTCCRSAGAEDLDRTEPASEVPC